MKMTPEYMAELHKFIHNSNSKNLDELTKKVREHLQFIPHKKLFRYRPCCDREFLTLQQNSIWLSRPTEFADVFDTMISMPEPRLLEFDYYLFFCSEIAYQTLIETAEEGEIIPLKADFIKKMYVEMHDALNKYSSEEITNAAITILGEEEYERMHSQMHSQHAQGFYKRASQIADLFKILAQFPRRNLTITSFTTDKDNRNMWENYADKYKGFCIEYDFAPIGRNLFPEDAFNILHLLPVSYRKKLPVFNHSTTLHRLVQSDIKVTEFDFDADSFLPQFYQAITTKQYDYRSEQEWRLIMDSSSNGAHYFPYISKVYAGKDISEEHLTELMRIAKQLNVPLFKQHVSLENSTFIYIKC